MVQKLESFSYFQAVSLDWLRCAAMQSDEFPFHDLIYGKLGEVHNPASSNRHFYCPGVYFAFAHEMVKIGHTTLPNNRFSGMRSPADKRIDYVICIPQQLIGGVGCGKAEKALHNCFQGDRVRGEWFRATDEITAFARSFEGPASALLKRYADWLKAQNAGWRTSGEQRDAALQHWKQVAGGQASYA